MKYGSNSQSISHFARHKNEGNTYDARRIMVNQIFQRIVLRRTVKWMVKTGTSNLFPDGQITNLSIFRIKKALKYEFFCPKFLFERLEPRVSKKTDDQKKGSEVNIN